MISFIGLVFVVAVLLIMTVGPMLLINKSPLRDGGRRERWARTVVRGSMVVTIGALVVLVAITASIFSAFRGMDDDGFDEIEAGFREHQSAFEAAADRMAGWSADHPDAVRIVWTQAFVCFADAGVAGSQCTDASTQEQEAFLQLAGATRVAWQAKDDGRVFFRFNFGNSAVQYLMFDPDDRDPRAYADAHMFRWGRMIGDGWSLLGDMSEIEGEHSWMFAD